MSDLTINLLSAFAVSTIISLMAQVQSQKLKAVLYSLPFPITIALIGSESIATSLSVVGLVLVAGFIWGCYVLHTRLKANILFADVFLAILYVVIACVLVRLLDASFWVATGLFGLCWIVLMINFRNRTFTYIEGGKSATNPFLKALVIFAVAFGLFSAHQYLAAFVVTFPYSGVFAVYENRNSLLPQAALFTRNSIAIAAYFVANYLVGTHFNSVTRYVCSWLAFGVVLIAVNKFIHVKIKAVAPV